MFGRLIRNWRAICFLAAFSGVAPPAIADPCMLRTAGEADTVRSLIMPRTTIVRHCWYCDRQTPIPVRVRDVELIRHAPDDVRISMSGQAFSLTELEQAERDNTGPLAASLRKSIEQDYADQDSIYDNDPYIAEEKRKVLAMHLGFARQDYEMRVWHEFRLNGEAADPRLLYVPIGENLFTSVGRQVGCLMDDAPQTVTYEPPRRIAARQSPPSPYIADVTGQCYDGSCPQPIWTARVATPAFATRDSGARPVSHLEAGEQVKPLQTLSYVVGGKGEVYRDHARFFAGDLFYLLDSQAEEFYRYWHYGDVFIADSNGLHVIWQGEPCADDGEHWGCVEAYPEETWWAKVRRADGSAVWILNPVEYLDGVLVQ